MIRQNSGAVSNTFCNDIGIQNYVIQHALLSIRPDDLFCKGLTLKHFYLLYNNGEGGFVKEDLLEQAQAACDGIEQNVTHFKQVLHADEPHMPMSEHCDTPTNAPTNATADASKPHTAKPTPPKRRLPHKEYPFPLLCFYFICISFLFHFDDRNKME